MSDSSSSSSSGIGFAGLLAVVFIVLKLTEVIDWSWWWVLSPLWIGLAIVLFILFLVVLVAVSKPKTSIIKRQFKKSNFQRRLEEMKQKRDNLK